MSVTLPASVQAQLESGRFHILPLVKFEIPGNTVGYYVGPRPLTWNGFTYQPNKLLEMDDLVETLDIDLGERELRFTNIPLGGDAIDDLEALDYTLAPVTVSRLIIDPSLGLPAGVLGPAETSFHEIMAVNYSEGAIGEDGQYSFDMTITLRTPGQAGRDSVRSLRTQEEQQFDNAANDTFYSRVGTSHQITRKWGRTSA